VGEIMGDEGKGGVRIRDRDKGGTRLSDKDENRWGSAGGGMKWRVFIHY